MTKFRPKIVYILPCYDLATGSHFFHIYELLKAAQNSLDIFLIVEKTKVLPRKLPFPFRVQRFRLAPLRFVELLFLLVRQRMRGVENFYTHYSFYGGLASWLAASLTGGRSFYWNCGMPWLYRRSFLEEAIFRFVLRQSILVTGTPAVAAAYQKHYNLDPKMTRVMPNWINISRFTARGEDNLRRRLNIPDDRKVILFLHRLSHRKGADLIPEIAAQITKRCKDVIFIIVGDGPERGNLEARIRNLGLGDRVRFLGKVPHCQTPDYFKAADVFMMPSEEEGFPHVLLEAQASGLPYVAFDVGGVREITPPGLAHFIVPPKDVKVFASWIVELLDFDSLERLRLARILTGWVRRYDLKEVLPKFVELFS